MKKKWKLTTALLLSAAVAAPTISVPPQTVYAAEAETSLVPEKDPLGFEINTADVSESARKFKTTIVFESYDDDDTGFNENTKRITIGETVFALNSIDNLTMVDSRTPRRRTLDRVSETFLAGMEEDYLPAETMEEDGVKWTLTEKELVESKIPDETRDAVTTKRYSGVEKGVPIPSTIDYTFTDELTGETVDTELPVTDQTDSQWYWTDFSFPITITGYDAEVFDLNGTEIRADEPLINHALDFLNLLGLDSEFYRVDSIEWDGEPYESRGNICRNAVGTGQKYVTDVDAVYSGTVTLPHRDGAAWKCVYTEELPENAAIYKYTADATYVSTADETPLERLLGFISAAYEAIIRAITEHPVIAALQILIIAAIIVLVLARRRRRCIYDRTNVCEYKRDCESCPYYKAYIMEPDEDPEE